MAENESSGMTAIVAIVAIVIIVSLGFFIFQNYVGKNAGGASVNLQIPGTNSSAQ